MRICSKLYSLGVAVFCAAIANAQTHNHASQPSRLAFFRTPPALDGAHLKVQLVEVTYAPGGSSPTHSHPCPVIGYVVQGALRTQVKGEAETVDRAGESFYEAPNGVHQISANASDKEPV